MALSKITTASLSDNAVTTAKITDANITTAKIADTAITTAKITDANITTAKIADSNITTAKVADDAVTNAKIGAGAVTNTEVNASASIASSKIISSNGTRVLLHSYALGVDTAYVEFNSTYITDTYDEYILEGKHCTPTVDNAEAVVHCSSDNGSNMATSGHARSYLRLNANPAQGAEAGSNNYIQIATDLGNDDNRGLTWECRFYGLRNTSHYKYMFFMTCGKHSADEYQWRGGSSIATTSAINYISFLFKPSGNIKAGGKIALYGIKGSNYS